MLDPVDRETERKLRERVDPTELARHLDAFEGLERVSGTADERAASEYVVETLTGFGVDAELHEYETLVSVPRDARVEVESPTPRTIEHAIATTFAASTPPGGLSGEIVHVDYESEASIDPAEIAGSVVFTRAYPEPDPIRRFEELGAEALVLESVGGDTLYREMKATPVWGTPGLADREAVRTIPVVEIGESDGEWLRDQLARSRVEATLHVDVDVDVTTLPCPVGRVPGEESDRYLLVGSHVDSWAEGMTDNAAAMAAALEMARIVADTPLRRGVVFGFWSGHSQAQYAGSAWFADENWVDLRRNGVAYLNLDLDGVAGAHTLGYQHMAELADEHFDAMGATEFDVAGPDEDYLGESPRPGRGGDQSFWGTGLSSLQASAQRDPGTSEGGPMGSGWWWHTPQDTRDKVDLDVLTAETRLFLAMTSRIAGSPVLPHDFRATVSDVREALADVEATTGARGSFGAVRDRLDALEGRLERATDAIERGDVPPEAVEELQVDLGNELVPALYASWSDHCHEPALEHDLLPALRVSGHVEERTPRDRLFGETTRRRAAARLEHRIGRAVSRTEEFLARVDR